ncbi:MAG: succinylglutamate desuccinylase/aspartoacylase family protein [Bacillota bacterium]
MLGKKGYIFLSVLLLLLLLSVSIWLKQEYAFFGIGGGHLLPGEPDRDQPAVTRTIRILEPGTAQETVLLIIAAPAEGPTIMVMGGVHGDEPAGYQAAGIISGWSIDRGTLLVLPRANAQAVASGTRYPPGSLNLNRSFPGSAVGNPTERLAASIYEVMAEFRPQWVVDLHEAREFERVQFDALGQTIIYPEDAPSLAVVEQIIAGLNRSLMEELHLFQVKRGGVAGGSISAARSLGLESFTVETTQELPLPDRVNQHLEAVRLLMSILEINVLDHSAN